MKNELIKINRDEDDDAAVASAFVHSSSAIVSREVMSCNPTPMSQKVSPFSQMHNPSERALSNNMSNFGKGTTYFFDDDDEDVDGEEEYSRY